MKRLPLLLRILIAIALGVMLGLVAPGWCVRLMNTFNGLFDQLLKFLIPLIILGLVAPAIADVGKGAGRMLLLTATLAYLFTVGAGLFSFGISHWIFPSFVDAGTLSALEREGATFSPYFTIAIPPLTDVMTSLVLAFMLGLGMAAFPARALSLGFSEFRGIIVRTITAVIIPLLPAYIFGLFLDMTAAGQVGAVLADFALVIAIIFSMTALWLLIQYAIAGIACRRNGWKCLLGMMPAYFTALGTSSSAATIPVTLKQALRNGVSEEVAGFCIPLCATIHLSGSTLKITACATALMLMLGMPYDFPTMLGFVLMLGVVMVAAPGVPGGAIMAALGVLESLLGFGAREQAMMITLYIAMDSFGTACNVTGDGAIALIVDHLHGLSNTRRKQAT